MTLRRVTITIDVDTDTDDATLDTRLTNYLNEEDLDSTLLGEEIRFVEFNLTITDPPGGIGIGDHVRSKGEPMACVNATPSTPNPRKNPPK